MITPKTLSLAAIVMTAAYVTSAHAEILIGVAGPITGQDAWVGEEQRQGAEMAVADINANGGVLGENVRLIVGDDACDPDQAVAVANKLVSDGVVFVAGHYCSHSSIPASKVYEKAGVLMISPGSTNPRLTDEGGDNVFRVSVQLRFDARSGLTRAKGPTHPSLRRSAPFLDPDLIFGRNRQPSGTSILTVESCLSTTKKNHAPARGFFVTVAHS